MIVMAAVLLVFRYRSGLLAFAGETHDLILVFLWPIFIVIVVLAVLGSAVSGRPDIGLHSPLLPISTLSGHATDKVFAKPTNARISAVSPAHCEESQDHLCSRMVEAARTPDGVSPKCRRNMRLK